MNGELRPRGIENKYDDRLQIDGPFLNKYVYRRLDNMEIDTDTLNLTFAKSSKRSMPARRFVSTIKPLYLRATVQQDTVKHNAFTRCLKVSKVFAGLGCRVH